MQKKINFISDVYLALDGPDSSLDFTTLSYSAIVFNHNKMFPSCKDCTSMFDDMGYS